MRSEDNIDFVVTWVDGNDPVWKASFVDYSQREGRDVDNTINRYRDWDTLRYWFRGVERFAPWVHKIYFVTYAHLPQWLKTEHPKLVIVKHEDFIPSKYLPTFSSFPIELFLHKIEGLTERFVYFNDDMFLLKNVSPQRFFRNGLPCDMAVQTLLPDGKFGNFVYQAVDLINRNFDKSEVIRRNFSQWYNLRYSKYILLNLIYSQERKFPGFIMNHLPQGYLKSTFNQVWEQCDEDLERTCSHKFRTYGDVIFWIVRYWQLASGNFMPYNIFSDGQFFQLNNECIPVIVDCIRRQKRNMICLNDPSEPIDFEKNKTKIIEAFNEMLPEKSSFEI